MQLNREPLKSSSFFDVVSGADEVFVRELACPAGSTPSPDTLLDAVKAVSERAPEDSFRVFAVFVKTPKPAPKQPSLPQGDIDQLRKSAELLLQSEDYLLARNLYSRVLGQSLHDPTSLRGLGICLLRLGEPVSARKCFRAWYEVHRDAAALVWSAACFITEGCLKDAADALNKIPDALVLNVAEQAEYWRLRATTLHRSGKAIDAMGALENSLRLRANCDQTWSQLGSLHLQDKAFESADRCFRRASEVNPRSSRAICGLGLAALGMGNLQRAALHLYRSVELDPQNFLAIESLFPIVSRTQDLERYRPLLLNYVEKNPGNAEAHALVAAISLQGGDLEACNAQAKRALQLDPKCPRAVELMVHLFDGQDTNSKNQTQLQEATA